MKNKTNKSDLHAEIVKDYITQQKIEVLNKAFPALMKVKRDKKVLEYKYELLLKNKINSSNTIIDRIKQTKYLELYLPNVREERKQDFFDEQFASESVFKPNKFDLREIKKEFGENINFYQLSVEEANNIRQIVFNYWKEKTNDGDYLIPGGKEDPFSMYIKTDKNGLEFLAIKESGSISGELINPVNVEEIENDFFKEIKKRLPLFQYESFLFVIHKIEPEKEIRKDEKERITYKVINGFSIETIIFFAYRAVIQLSLDRDISNNPVFMKYREKMKVHCI